MCQAFSWSSSELGVLNSVVIACSLIHWTVEGGRLGYSLQYMLALTATAEVVAGSHWG